MATALAAIAAPKPGRSDLPSPYDAGCSGKKGDDQTDGLRKWFVMAAEEGAGYGAKGDFDYTAPLFIPGGIDIKGAGAHAFKLRGMFAPGTIYGRLQNANRAGPGEEIVDEHIAFSGTCFESPGIPSPPGTQNLLFVGVRGLFVDHCLVQDSTRHGIILSNIEHARFSASEYTRIGVPGAYTGPEGQYEGGLALFFYKACLHVWITDNYFHDLYGGGNWMNPDSGQYFHHRGNTYVRCREVAYVASPPDSLHIGNIGDQVPLMDVSGHVGETQGDRFILALNILRRAANQPLTVTDPHDALILANLMDRGIMLRAYSSTDGPRDTTVAMNRVTTADAAVQLFDSDGNAAPALVLPSVALSGNQRVG